MKPLAIDLCCGLGGWAEGLLAEQWDVVGFDIERYQYGAHRYPAQLVIQDVLTLHGAQFRDAALIVASPPCQAYSWMAMPWSRAKARAAEIRADETGQMLADLNRLFDACFRIQAQASLAAGRHIPMVVENVRGAVPWVGPARGNFGSFYLWGDVPGSSTQLSLLGDPPTVERVRLTNGYSTQKFNPDGTPHGQGSWFAVADSKNRGSQKLPGFRFDGSGRSFQSESVKQHGSGREWWDKALDERRKEATAIKNGRKQPGINLSEVGFNVANARELGVSDPNYRRTDEDKRQHIGSSRKAASAMIAKIPEPLARHIARVYRP